MSEFIVKNETNLFKKVIFVISIAFILIILNSYSHDINALLVDRDELVHISKDKDLNLINNIPIYISKFWKSLTVYQIPNNYEKYNCTATVQMLYAVWLKKLSAELGYTNVNEMLDYSLKVVKIKEIIDSLMENPLNNYNSSVPKTPSLQEKQCFEKIYQILNSSYYRGDEYDAIDNFLIKIGLIDDGDFKSSTWEIFDLMLSKGSAVYEKMDRNGKRGIDIWKESKTYLPLDEKAINSVLPGDILTGKYYATHYPEKYTTHLTVYLGIRDEKHSFAEQFGDETRIIPLEKMYKALRTGFEAVFRPVVIISPEKTEEFLAAPLNEHDFASPTPPQLLFFKDEAKNFLFPIQLTINEFIKEKKEIS
ncbi:MAG: hypothetical protein AB1567_00710 [bacterium]